MAQLFTPPLLLLLLIALSSPAIAPIPNTSPIPAPPKAATNTTVPVAAAKTSSPTANPVKAASSSGAPAVSKAPVQNKAVWYGDDSTASYINAYNEMIKQYKREYKTALQQFYRVSVVRLNVLRIQMMNNDTNNTFKTGMSPHLDLTQEEFASYYLNVQPPTPLTTLLSLADLDKYKNQVKVPVDWKKVGTKNQKNVAYLDRCGSSWAFVSASVLQGALQIDPDLKQTIAFQQVIDCAPTSGTACDGGSIPLGLDYLKTMGITFLMYYGENDARPNYPQPCNKDILSIFRISDYIVLSGCTAMLQSLRKSPVALTVDATHWALYQSGVMNKCGRGPNYAAILIGSTKDYWLVKATFGKGWGEQGYIRIAAGNTCGICNYAIEIVL